MGPNSRPRLRGPREGRQPEPVPYGTPFSAILRRFTQAPRKPWPTGRRPAAAFARHPAPARPACAKPQLEGLGPNSRPRLRGPREGRQPEPVPYGTPFSAILRRFTQAPRKPWPTGRRPPDPAGIGSSPRNGRTPPQFYIAPDARVATGSG